MIRFSLIFICFSLIGFQLKAQEDDFSQYMLSSIYLNPAYASAYPDLSLNLNYRSQDIGESSTMETSQVSAVFPIKLDNVSDNIAGVGIMAFNQKSDDLGGKPFSSNGLFLTYSQNFSLGLLGSDLIAVGVQGGYSRSSSTLSSLFWGSDYSKYYTSGSAGVGSVTEFDNYSNKLVVNVGFMYYYNRKRNYLLHNYSAFSGIAVSNVSRPNDSFRGGNAKVPMIYRYHGGIEVRLNNLYVLPNALVNFSRETLTANVGMHLAYSFESTARFTSANKGFQLLLGSWYRVKQSYTFLGGLQFNTLAIRGSYDMNSNLFFGNSDDPLQVTPAYEISILYTLSSDPTLRRMNNALF